MKIRRYIVCFLLVVVVPLALLGQQSIRINRTEFRIKKSGFKEAWSNIRMGDAIFDQGRAYYLEALSYYQKAYPYNADNAELNYKIGVCYLFSDEKSKGEMYLSRAHEVNRQVAQDILLVLGKALLYNYKFDAASACLEQYRATLSPKLYFEQIPDIERLINNCKEGKRIVNAPVKTTIRNLGTVINSKYDDYGPLITADCRKMIFTSRRAETTGGVFNPLSNSYYEDVFLALRQDNNFVGAVPLSSRINSPAIDAAIGMSNDGHTIFLYNGLQYKGNIYYAEFRRRKYSEKMPLPFSINSKYHEMSASMSPDGQTLYFVSNRTDANFGGHDIYKSVKNFRGKWGKPINLGSTINTAYDEVSVFAHPDGRTLYFTSNGHAAVGGFDVFRTDYEPETERWSTPQNVGYPINTTANEFQFVISANGRKAYFSSDREGGVGGLDIYEADFGTATNSQHLHSLTLVSGTVDNYVKCRSRNITIEIFDTQTGKTYQQLKADKLNGDFLFSLPAGKRYGVIYHNLSGVFHSEQYNLQTDTLYHEFTRKIQLADLRRDTVIELSNIFFMRGRPTLSPQSMRELEHLTDMLTMYNNLQVNVLIQSNTGESADNKAELAVLRGEKIMKYLRRKMVARSRLACSAIVLPESEGRASPRVQIQVIPRSTHF